MPSRSDRPGLKWKTSRDGLREQPDWVASQVVRDTLDYPDKTIRLPADADDEALAQMCRDLTAQLMLWIEQRGSRTSITQYDGTIRSLSRIYQEHEESGFRDVKANTRKTYTDSIKVIESTVGNRVIRNETVLDVKRWYKLWKEPATPTGQPRVKRAHDAVAMLRQILRFGFALGYEECGVLAERLSVLRFEKGGAREEEMTPHQAVAFVRKALELEEGGEWPEGRARMMALGVAAQFDLMLRQKDIIGEWRTAVPGTEGAIYHGTEMWVGPFRWDNIPGWKLRLKTSKTKGRTGFDLAKYSILWPLLEASPHQDRVGSIVKVSMGSQCGSARTAPGSGR